MSRVHFTADHHFGHEGIIGMCNRPFASAEEMDESFIKYWNAVVRPNDKVWHLGDFSHRADPKRMRSLFDRLNGTKHLVIGNHDREATLQLPWASQQQMAVLCVDGISSVLCHYGMRVWPKQRRGAVHLYGHSHGRLLGTSLSLDVGVDCWNYMPVNIKQILDRIRELPNIHSEGDPELACKQGALRRR